MMKFHLCFICIAALLSFSLKAEEEIPRAKPKIHLLPVKITPTDSYLESKITKTAIWFLHKQGRYELVVGEGIDYRKEIIGLKTVKIESQRRKNLYDVKIVLREQKNGKILKKIESQNITKKKYLGKVEHLLGTIFKRDIKEPSNKVKQRRQKVSIPGPKVITIGKASGKKFKSNVKVISEKDVIIRAKKKAIAIKEKTEREKTWDQGKKPEDVGPGEVAILDESLKPQGRQVIVRDLRSSPVKPPPGKTVYIKGRVIREPEPEDPPIEIEVAEQKKKPKPPPKPLPPAPAPPIAPPPSPAPPEEPPRQKIPFVVGVVLDYEMINSSDLIRDVSANILRYGFSLENDWINIVGQEGRALFGLRASMYSKEVIYRNLNEKLPIELHAQAGYRHYFLDDSLNLDASINYSKFSFANFRRAFVGLDLGEISEIGLTLATDWRFHLWTKLGLGGSFTFPFSQSITYGNVSGSTSSGLAYQGHLDYYLGQKKTSALRLFYKKRSFSLSQLPSFEYSSSTVGLEYRLSFSL